MPWLSAIVAAEGLDSSTVNVSVGSTRRSPATLMTMTFLVCPGAKDSVPDRGV